MIADELDDPVGPEFRTTFDEQNFGLPLADALEHMAVRMPLLDVRFFVTAVLIQRDTGGISPRFSTTWRGSCANGSRFVVRSGCTPRMAA